MRSRPISAQYALGTSLRPLDPTALIEPITAAADIQKWDVRSAAWKSTCCPENLAKCLLARPTWELPFLTGVINTPTLRPDGSLLDMPGYDTRTGILFSPQSSDTFPAIPEEPTRADAVASLEVLNELIGEFEFTAPAGYSVALAALMTGVVRRSLLTAPLFGVTAPTAGSGTGLLCDIISWLAIGRKAVSITQASEEETEKRLAGTLIRGDGVICIDNCTRPLGGDKLNSVLTAPVAALRPLGGSKIINCRTEALFLANGNNLTAPGDMSRRVLLAEIDPQVERPETRVFKSRPLELMAQNRGRYVMAALTILRAYLAVRATVAAKLPALGSYQEWSDLVRAAIVWLGLSDPCETMALSQLADPDRELMIAVLRLWEAGVGTSWITAKGVLERARNKPDFLRALNDACATVSRGQALTEQVLGTWLGNHKDRWVDDDHRRVCKRINQGQSQWALQLR